ncbi:MAG: hypothetical protein M1155_02110 [Patescibacteria group bacterium]|nr:hypothetical protein [Patescibacteria group bacterium]
MDSNLLAKNDAAEVDTSIPKISVLVFLEIGFAVSFGYFTSKFVKAPGAGTFTLAGASALLFMILFFLRSLFVKGKSLNLFIILGDVIALSLFFIINSYTFTMIVAAAIAYLALYSALKKSKNELSNQLNIKTGKIARISIPKIASALAVLISVVYAQPFYPANNIVISKNIISTIITPSETLLKIADNYLHLGLGDFSVNKTLPEIADQMASSSIEQLAVQNNIPVSALESQRKTLTNSTLQMLEKQSENIGIQIKTNETVLDGIYNFVNTKLQSLDTTVKWVVYLSLFLVIFLTIKSLFWLFYWLAYLFIFLFYEILMALGFSKTTYQQISKEIIIL